jgi:hypothetical protein
LGDGADRPVLEGLGLAWSGATLWAGMGHMPFAEIPGGLTDVARMLLRSER